MGRKQSHLFLPLIAIALVGCSNSSVAQVSELPTSTTTFGKNVFPLVGLSKAALNAQLTSKKLKAEGGFQIDGDAAIFQGPFGKTEGIEWDIWRFSAEDAKKGSTFYAYLYQDLDAKKVFALLGLKLEDWKKSDWMHTFDGKAEKGGDMYSWKQFRIGIEIRKDRQFTTLEIWRDPTSK